MCTRFALVDTSTSLNKSTITTTTKKISSKRLTCFIFLLFTTFAGVVGREALRPPVDVEDELKLIVEEENFFQAKDALPCSIDIQRELPKSNQSQPLYLRPNSTEYWLPNSEGYLEVPVGERIELTCTGSFANVSGEYGTNGPHIEKGIRTIRPRCVHGMTFQLNDAKHELRAFTCAQKVKYTAECLPQRCGNSNAQLYRIGYNLTDSRFVETMRACYDAAEVRTLFVRYPLTPANVHFQRGVKRSGFSKLGHFEADMHSFYTRKNQHSRATQLLGGAEESMKYLSVKSRMLSRGHLAAKSDMIYATQQRTTFNFFNVAPQWQAFNGGAWATLEEKVRTFVAQTQQAVSSYTGTHGIMRFGNASAPFYLAVDENNNGVLPVPKLIYRVIVAIGRNVGVALVGVNNPYVGMDEIRKEYVICEDVREQVPWLRSWMRNSEKSLKRGYLYACRVAEFVEKVTDLPRELADVTELLK